MNRLFLDGVVPIAETVPLRVLGLREAGEVGCPSADRDRPGAVDMRDQLPPLPAVPFAITHQAGLLPWPPADAHLDSSDRGGPGPCHPTNNEIASGELFIRPGLGDQRAYPLQGDGLPEHFPVALPLVEVGADLVVTAEGLADDHDLRQPLDCPDAVPAGNDDSQGIAVL